MGPHFSAPTDISRTGKRRRRERIGALKLWYAVECTAQELTMHLRHVTAFGMVVPGWICPRVSATEHGDDARLHFDVRVFGPGRRRIIGYAGCLDLAPVTSPG